MKGKVIFGIDICLLVAMFCYLCLALLFVGEFPAYGMAVFLAAFAVSMIVNRSVANHVVAICTVGILFAIMFWLTISSFIVAAM